MSTQEGPWVFPKHGLSYQCDFKGPYTRHRLGTWEPRTIIVCHKNNIKLIKQLNFHCSGPTQMQEEKIQTLKEATCPSAATRKEVLKMSPTASSSFSEPRLHHQCQASTLLWNLLPISGCCSPNTAPHTQSGSEGVWFPGEHRHMC